MNTVLIRKIELKDNEVIANVVKTVMLEYKANPRTTVLGDPKLLTMYENYLDPRSVYYVVELDRKVVGGCGVKQLDGTKENICELQRMFLLSEARGKGIGRLLMERCLNDASLFGFDKIYLESLSNMVEAIGLYRKYGFVEIPKPLGDTGHAGCNVIMIRNVKN